MQNVFVEGTRTDDLAKLEEAFAQRIPLSLVVENGGDEEGWRAMLRQAAEKAVLDPFRFGYRNPVWDLAERTLGELRAKFAVGVIYLIVLGGHRSSKSEWASWHVSKKISTVAGSRWWCADATEAASRDNQQRYIERYLPPEWRPGESGVLNKRRSKYEKVRFSQAGGFTENALVLPNRSETRFKFYEQKLSTLQAVALDGFWGDELLPYDWISELEWRLVERNGEFIATFTPYEFWTQTVGHFIEGAKVIDEVSGDPELLPLLGQKSGRATNQVTAEKVHRVLQCENERARVIYFHSSDNPIFGNWPAVKAKALKLPTHEVRMRVYGMVDKGAHAQFPLFSNHVHVLSTKDWEKMRKQWGEGDRFHLVDPCSGRLWFMIWVWCPRPLKWIIYREWPSYGHPGAYIAGVGDPGPWAVLGEAEDGERGPAQKNRGFGLERYKLEIEKVEGKDEGIFERWIDARYSNSPREEREGTTTLIEQMAEVGMYFRAMVSETKILGVHDGSIDMINSALYYDVDTAPGKFSKELGRVNEPQLQVLETCPNTIWSFKNWTGKDGVQGACKDPVDVVRGMFLSQIGFQEAGMYMWTR